MLKKGDFRVLDCEFTPSGYGKDEGKSEVGVAQRMPLFGIKHGRKRCCVI
jgi:hypothetical protein